jgi:UDP:flavonoid glycosyltransferase YjiC (YdhE family)
VMGDGRYRENARRIRDAIARRDGLREAADAVEGVLRAPAAPAEVAGKPAR